ncbi:MAG: RNase adaptor protein RapZ [Desulfobacteraceae bacterium 4572_35.1]|nr:MAG: RNase adaptor protein RapZ [Desulfobacteraceae bacterium 4572_35.1]
MNFIVITGLSGSGKSTAARVLEDEGYYVVDNLPIALIAQLLEQESIDTLARSGIAIVVDARNPASLAEGKISFDKIRSAGHKLEIYFLDATDEALIRRFSTTRRRHPLGRHSNIASAIEQERSMLQPYRVIADVVFDTTELSVHQLKASVLLQLYEEIDNAVPMVVRLQSFGFRYGIPLESDLVLDVRFLPNPHYNDSLRPLSGLDKPVREYVFSKSQCHEFIQRTTSWLSFLLPQYRCEGKSYLTVSVGCTGGHHRSVAIVEALQAIIKETHNVKVFHRDLVKEEG